MIVNPDTAQSGTKIKKTKKHFLDRIENKQEPKILSEQEFERASAENEEQYHFFNAPYRSINHEFESANASSWNGTHAVVWTVKNAATGERVVVKVGEGKKDLLLDLPVPGAPSASPSASPQAR